jgi:ferredoxin-nitrate reductase
MRESFGSDGQPGSYNDIDYADCIMLVGHNMSATQTVLWSRILDRLAGPIPPTLIVIDPRKTNSAKEAHLHLAPNIGTNLALLNGIQHLLFKKGYVNHGYVANHTVGVDELREVVEEYTPEMTSGIAGVPAEDVIRCADILGKSKALLSTCLQGVYQSNQATASACQVNNINLLLGHIGKPGAGVLQMNGQPTAQNNREAGCDGEYPGFRNFSNEAHMMELAGLWNIDHKVLPHWGEPTHIENMLKFIKQDSMEMMWISGTNPMVSLPNLPMVRDLLTKEELFIVVQDIFPTETTAIADVVLPAAAWGEKTGCFTNADRTVHLSLKAVNPPGEAKSDFDIFCDLSRRMDFRDRDGKPLIPWTDPSEAFEAWKRVSKGRPCDYSGITYEKLRGVSGIQWPCNEEYPIGKERLFDDGKFFTDIDYCESFTHDLETGVPLNKDQYKHLNPAGRAILKACHYVPETEPVNEDYPYHLSTGRLTHHFHTRTKTGRTKELQDLEPEPFIQVSEHDAKELGVTEGDVVLVESRRGRVEVPVRVGKIVEKQVFLPFHYGYFDSNDGRARAANELTRGRMVEMATSPGYHLNTLLILYRTVGRGFQATHVQIRRGTHNQNPATAKRCRRSQDPR